MPPFIILFNTVFHVLAMGLEKKKKDTQGTKIRKEYVELGLSMHERPYRTK